MIAGQLILAYHGCDATTRDDLVSGRLAHLSPSKNQYDWLGPGTYFYENDLERALKFAHASYENPARLYTKKAIGTPAVVGAILKLQHVLDMTTQLGIDEFSQACEGAEAVFEAVGKFPQNAPASDDDVEIILRSYDNAIFNYLHAARDAVSLQPYQAVRGAFSQGSKVKNSAFHTHTHIQLAVRDSACVVGWFMPAGAQLQSPDEYAASKERQLQQESVRRALKQQRARAGAAERPR